MLCRSKLVSALLLGDWKRFLCIILVNMVPECVVNKLDGVRGGPKDNFMSRDVSMGSFIKKFRYPSQNQKSIHTQMSGSTSLVKYGVCALLVDFYLPFRGVLLWLISLISAGVDIVLAHDLLKGFASFHMGIFGVNMGRCTLITD